MIDTEDGFLAFLKASVASAPDRLYMRYDGDDITVGEIDRWSNALANWLTREGIEPGARIALMVRNSPEVIALIFAIAKARAIWVPINTQARGENLKYVLTHAAPRMIVTDGDLVDIITASGFNTASATVWTMRAEGSPAGTSTSVAEQLCAPGQYDAAPPGTDEPVAIMYTSGTTGPAKGRDRLAPHALTVGRKYRAHDRCRRG